MLARTERKAIRSRVRRRIRKKISGTADRPRLAVFRSNKYIYVQAIDDQTGRTLASASSLEGGLRPQSGGKGTVEAAKTIGTAIAERLKGAGVENVVFDRGGFVYHGCVKAVADAAREAGLKF